MSKNVLPFHCGTQIMDWKMNNCEKCQKGYDEKESDWRCPLERGMDQCYMGDGSYPPDLAKAIGMPEDVKAYLWRCPEFQEAVAPTPTQPKPDPNQLLLLSERA